MFGTDGVSCDEVETLSSANTDSLTLRMLQTKAIVDSTEYYVVMPDLFASYGYLDETKTFLESTAFSPLASTIFLGITLSSISCSINSDYPIIPLINSPIVSQVNNSITLTWTGAANTDGFIFAGITSNGTSSPTALQLKKNSGYKFDAFKKAFYYKGT